MSSEHTEKRYTTGEEIAHAITHGLGLLLSVAACSVMVILAAQRGTVWHITGVAVFGATLIVLYAASTLYHSLTHKKAKRVFQFLDYSAIYLLIAGSYTPFTSGNIARGLGVGPVRGGLGAGDYGRRGGGGHQTEVQSPFDGVLPGDGMVDRCRRQTIV